MADIVIGLKTLETRSVVSIPQRATKRRAFTEQEYIYMQCLPTPELIRRIGIGKQIIALLYNPVMANMTQQEADKVSSNLKFQIEEIEKIIRERNLENG